MRLLRSNHDGSLRLVSRTGADIPEYAILSHTWEADDQEVTFRDIGNGTGIDKNGFRKLHFCRERAHSDDIQYFWVDSCCIDRSSSAELTESINSMFRWYKNATKCYAFLSDVETARSDMQQLCRAKWFTRGWTLQELIAPAAVEFYAADGSFIGDKLSLEKVICQETGIPTQALQQTESLSHFSVEERMSWVARRKTTLEEDEAYCLFGIFEIYLPAIYGEGKENAFRRLRLEVSAAHGRDPPRPKDGVAAEKADACMANLAATDQARFYQQVLNRSRGSCTWILRHEEFLQWAKKNTSGLLWLTAKPGCGKTTIAANICRMIADNSLIEEPTLANSVSRDVTLSFFFQRSNNEKTTSASAALRTLVQQLARRIPACLQILIKRQDSLSTKGDFQWSLDTLVTVLNEMLESGSLARRIWIIVDAVDECSSQFRRSLIDCFEEIVDRHNSSRTSNFPIKILMTSRPDGDMVELLGQISVLEVTETETLDDIQALIQGRVQNFARQRHLRKYTSDNITQLLQQNARGMFLWVDLIMEELERRDQRLTDDVIHNKLSGTPLSLVDTYITILSKVPTTRKGDMWRIFRWMIFSSRNLTLAELEAALCFETGTSTWHDFAGDLVFLCGSLVRSSGPLDEVSFVHQTARAFIESYSRDFDDCADDVSFDAASANEAIATTCMQILMNDEILTELMEVSHRNYKAWMRALNEFLIRHPFVRYAVDSWAFHLRVIGKPSSRISQMVQALLLMSKRRDMIMELTYFINKASWSIPVHQTPLHLAAYFNIPFLAQLYISRDNKSIHQTTGMQDTPLIWASEMGSTEVVQMLLDAGANPNAFEIDGWSALHWASRNGHLDVVNLLVKHGASLNQKDRDDLTPLDWAIDREHHHIVSVLWDGTTRPRGTGGYSSHPRFKSPVQGNLLEGVQKAGLLWNQRP